MMKNKKIIMVFILIIACLFMMISGVKATNPLNVTDITGGQSGEGQGSTTNPTPTPNTNPTQNPTPSPTPSGNNATGNGEQTNSLPDTGVAEDTALFVFITICVVSSVYAFVKIRNYKNV